MKKAKSAIAFLVVFVLLVVGFTVYTIVDKNRPDSGGETTGTTTPAEYVTDLKIADLSKVEIKNEDGLFEWDVVSLDKEDEFEFELVSPEISNVNNATAMAKVNGLLRLKLDSEANANASNLADYGLDTPSATAIFTLKDGSTKTLEMGDLLRGSTTKAYARLDGSNRVVVLTNIPNLMGFKTADLISTTIQPFELYEVDSFELRRLQDDMYIKLSVLETELAAGVTPTPVPTVTPSATELNEAAALRNWQIVEPFEWEGDATDLNAMLAEFIAVKAKQVLATSIDDPATYGLDQPAYSFTLYKEDETVTVSIGKEESSGIRYMSVSGRDELMTIDMSSFTLIDRPRVELASSFVSLINIQDVAEIILTTPEGKYVMDVFHPSNAEMEEDETLDYAYTINGKDATIVNKSDDYYFRKLYSGILSLMVEGEDRESEAEGDVVYSYTITKRTGDKSSITVDFYQRNDMTYYIYKNGEYTGFYTTKRRIDNDTTSLMNLGLNQLLERMLYAMDHAVDGKYIFPDD